MRVFISSTNEDLKEYRNAAKDAAIGADFVPDMQEYWEAGGRPPLEKCIDRVESSDVVVAIVAHRYGWTPDEQSGGERKSITWLECEAAVKAGKEVLAFLIDENYSWPEKLKESYQATIAVEKGEFTPELIQTIQVNVQGLKKFKSWLNAKVTREQFTTPDNLRGKIQWALNKWREGQAAGAGHPPLPSPPREERRIGLAFSGAGESFRNREGELAQLHEHLQNPGVRLISVVGPAGVGKTALASELCRQVESGDLCLSSTSGKMGVDGVVYFVCRGAETQMAERLFHDISRLLDDEQYKQVGDYWTDATREDADKFEFLLSKLRGGCFLIAIDNFEDALDEKNSKVADPSLATFLRVCLTTRHPLRIMATSRTWISVDVEAKQAMRTVELTKGLPNDEAIAMLRDLDPEGDVGIDDEPGDVLEKIVLKCRGLPSALQRVVGMLHDDLTLTLSDLLDSDAIGKDPLAEQYERQSEDRRRVLQALAVFDRPIKHHAVTHLLTGCGFDAKVGECLSALKRNYLVERAEVRGAFSLQASVRQYAYRKIPDEGDNYSKRRCHALAADYFAQQRTLPSDWTNIEDLTPQLEEFRHRCLAGEFNAAAELLEEIDEDHLQKWGHYRMVIALREQLADQLTDENLAPSNLGGLGMVYRRTGSIRESIEFFEQAIELAERNKNTLEQCRWLGELANTKADLLEMQEASDLYHRAIEIARANQHHQREARNLGNLAILHRQLGGFEKAIDYYEQALEIDRRVDDRLWEGIHLGNLGKAYEALGDLDQALQCYEQGRTISKKIQSTYTVAVDTFHIGEIHIKRGEFAKGKECCEASIATCREIDETRVRSYALELLGAVYHIEKDRQRAREAFEEGLQLEVPETCYRLTGRLGILRLDEGDQQEAARLLAESAQQCEKLIKDSPHYYEALYFLALARLAGSQTEDALAAYQGAIEVSRAKGVVGDALREIDWLSQTLPQTPGIDDARKLLQDAIA